MDCLYYIYDNEKFKFLAIKSLFENEDQLFLKLFMAKWDYKAERITTGFGGVNKLEEILNIYGEDGYELVTIDPKGVYIFKKLNKN